MVSAPAYEEADPGPLRQLRVVRERGAAWSDPPLRAGGDDALVASVALGGIELIDRLAPAWRALCDEAGSEPFLHPDWLRSYVATRAPGARVVLVTAREQGPGGQLRAVLPLLDEAVRFHGVPIRRWRSIGDLRSPERFDLVHRDADRDRATAAVWGALRAARGWDLVELAAVGAGSAAAALRDLAAAEGAPVATRLALTTPYLPLPDDGPGGDAAVFAGTTTKFRANLRRCMRNLEQVGPVRLVRVERWDEALVERFLALEAAGWKGRNGTAISSRPDTDAFFREIMRVAAANGWLTIYALLCGERPVAIHLGLTWAGPEGRATTYGVPKLTYDETLQAHAPGHLIVQAILRDCVARGVTEFDFLADTAPWKREWTADYRVGERSFIFRRTPRGLLAHAVRFRLLPAARTARTSLPRRLASLPPLRLSVSRPSLRRRSSRPA